MSGAVFDVVVVGAAGVDTCVYLPASPAATDVWADTTFTDNRDGVGQAGGYAARGYAALGLRTAYVGALADDPAGRLVRATLEAEGIDCRACFDDPAGTARSVNLMTPDGRRRGFYDGRGNPALVPDLRPIRDVVHGARLCHVNIPNWARHVLPLAWDAGAIVVSDLQDVTDPADAYREDFVAGSDVVCFSTASGLDPRTVMRSFWQRNPGLILLAGMGASGCAVGVDGRVRHQPAIQLDLPIVDTNGAGDALAVGFAVAHCLDALDLDESLRRAQLGARIICSQRVPKTRFVTRSDLGET